MKKILLLVLCASLFGVLNTSAQAPPFFNSASVGTSSNSFPLNTATSNKVQWIYNPGTFSTGGGGAGTAAFFGLIDTLWLRSGTTTTPNWGGLEISFSQSVGTQTAWTNGTYVTAGLTSAFGPGTYSPGAVTSGGWYAIPLTTPYLYNPALSLVVEVRQNSYTPGVTTRQATTLNKRIWGGYTATSGSFGSGLADMGLSLLSPLPCATPSALTATNLTSTSADIGWTENGTATTWEIEWGASGFTPTGTPNLTTTTNPHALSGLTQNTSYDYYVRAYCGVGDSSYYNGPFTFTTLATCPWPTALTNSNVSASGADFAWTENGVATTWEVELILAGGTFTGNPTFPATTTNPLSFPAGLIPNQCFEWKVRSICGPGDTSVWSPMTGSFCTPCVAFLPPYCMDFDTVSTTGTGPTPLTISCWSNYSELSASTTSDMWGCQVSGGGGPGYGVSGSNDHTSGTGRFAWVDFSDINPPDGAAVLETAEVDVTSLTVPRFSMWILSNNTNNATDNNTLTVDIWDGAAWNNGVIVYAASDPNWVELTYDMGSLTITGPIKARIKASSTASTDFYNDILIDDICIVEAPSCLDPTNLMASAITSTSATITWTDANATAPMNNFDLEVVPSGTAPTGVPTQTNVTSPYSLTGLTLLNAVDVYVRANCSATDSSLWVGPLTILPCSPLAGVYTIDPALAAGGTNFQSFTDAALALQCGISAPVTFNVNVAGSPYTEEFDIPEVMGNTPTNTITWNGNGATVTFASAPATTTADRHTMRISGADHMFFNDLTFINTGTLRAHAVHIWNNSNDIEFNNCTFEVSTTLTTSDVNAFVSCNVSADATTSAGAAGTGGNDSIRLDSCTFTGGYYGAYLIGGGNANNAKGNTISNSTIEDFYFYGAYNFYSEDVLISKNEILRPTRTNGGFYGIYFSGTSANNLIEKNHLHTAFGSTTVTGSSYPIYLFVDATPAEPTVVENNLIEDIQTNGTIYGIYSSTAQNLTVRHNTVVLDFAGTTSTSLTRGIVQFGTTAQNQVCQNNNIVVARGGAGTKYGMYLQATGTNLTEGNNNVYMNAAAGTNYYGYYQGTNCTALADWTTAGGTACTDVDPLFVAPASDDYTPANSLMDNTGAPLGVADDFLDSVRSATTPDAGAFEFSVSCPQPNALTATNITANSADLDWTELGAATTWEYEVVPTTTTPTGTGTVVTAKPTTASGLMPTTVYDYYVRSICGPMDSSLWSGPFTFATLSSCDSVTAITVSAITANTATIAWTENNIPPATAWQVEIVPQGTAPTGVGTPVTTNPYNATGLNAATDYDVYVRTDCGTSTSFWNGPTPFTTLCGAITVSQFNTDGHFDYAGTATSGALPNCWTNVGSDPWDFIGDCCPGYDVANFPDHTSNTVRSYAWNDGSTTSNVVSTMTSAPILNADIAAMTSPMLEFYLVSHTLLASAADNAPTDYNLFWAEVSYDNGTTWVEVAFNNGELGPDWRRFQIELDKTALGTNDLLVRFNAHDNATTTTAFYNDILLDDAAIIDATCASELNGGIASTDGTADCECNDLNGWTHYGAETSGEILLSVKKNTTRDPNINAHIVSVGGTTAGYTDLSTAPYVTSPWWIAMNRYWDIDVAAANTGRQPSTPVDVRFYYSTADYNQVVTGVGAATPAPVSALGAHTDMFFYKIATGINANPTTGHTTVNTADYTQLTNGATSSLTNWAYSAFGTDHQAEYQVATFSGGGGGFGHSNGALPVELISFDAQKEGSITKLTWVTAQEQNNSHFNVQRSADGESFENLGRVNSLAPNGNSSYDLNYLFNDKNPAIGHNYYRLQQVDIDGQISYSEVIDIIWGANGSTVSIYPNPTSDMINIDIASENTAQVEVKVLDMSGRIVKSVLAQAVKGVNTLQVNLDELANGVYGVQVYTNNKLTHIDKVRKNN